MSENGIFTRVAITREGDKVTKIRSMYFYQSPATMMAYVRVTNLELEEYLEYIELFEVKGEGLAMDSHGWIFPVKFHFHLISEEQAGNLRVALDNGKVFLMTGDFSTCKGKEFTFVNPEFVLTDENVHEQFDRAVQVNYLV